MTSNPDARGVETLTDLEREMLAFERQWWRRPGAKDSAIRDIFGLSPTRYHQLLSRLIDQPAAFVADPQVVNRLRRRRDERGRLRDGRRLAG